jgi:hypothetical protein
MRPMMTPGDDYVDEDTGKKMTKERNQKMMQVMRTQIMVSP